MRQYTTWTHKYAREHLISFQQNITYRNAPQEFSTRNRLHPKQDSRPCSSHLGHLIRRKLTRDIRHHMTESCPKDRIPPRLQPQASIQTATAYRKGESGVTGAFGDRIQRWSSCPVSRNGFWLGGRFVCSEWRVRRDISQDRARMDRCGYRACDVVIL